MYKRISAVMFPFIACCLIGAVIWGYQEHQEKKLVLIKAENQYQRSFHDLTYHVNKLYGELGQALAINTKSQGMYRKGLANIWRLTCQAQNEINQLPLTLLPFQKTGEFLSRISNFSYRAAVRDMTKQPLNKGEINILKTLYHNAAQITQDLQQVQHKVIHNHLRWTDVEIALASKKKQMDNVIIDGFKTVDKKVGEYPKLNWGPAVASLYTTRSAKMLSGSPLAVSQIKVKAEKFLIKKPNGTLQVRKNGQGTEYESYTVFTKSTTDGTALTLDYTKQGLLMSYMNVRPVSKQRLSMIQAEAAAKKFLKKHGYHRMDTVCYDQFHSVGNFTLVPVVNDVYIYPQRVIVRVALDNGEITGLQATEYIYGHKDRHIMKPKQNKKIAQAALHPQMKVVFDRLALIKNDQAEEVLCYEFGGTINGGTYRVYINAENGTEEQIEEMKPVKT